MNNNNVFNLQLDKETTTKALNDFILYKIKNGVQQIPILCKSTQTYSNVCAPVSAVLEYYRNLGIHFDIQYTNEDKKAIFVLQSHFDCPLIVEDPDNKGDLQHPFNKVWKFSTEQGIYELASAFVLALRKADTVAEGIIQSVDWCINETMDNVFVHSEGSNGYAMAQYFPTSGHFAFCVFDTGVGILQSFKHSKKHFPKDGLDAISLALQEHVTSDESVGQGNGMWGMSQIVDANGGSFTVCSSGAKYQNRYGNIRTAQTGEFHLGANHGTTFVEFQLDCKNAVDVPKTLDGYAPMDMWEDSHLDDSDLESIRISIALESSGTGTRISGKHMRNMVTNLLKEKHNVILDFDGVNFISSSYADELIGKLIASIGFIQFINHVKLKSISSYSVPIINRSVSQRMAQTYYDNTIPDVTDNESH